MIYFIDKINVLNIEDKKKINICYIQMPIYKF